MMSISRSPGTRTLASRGCVFFFRALWARWRGEAKHGVLLFPKLFTILACYDGSMMVRCKTRKVTRRVVEEGREGRTRRTRGRGRGLSRRSAPVTASNLNKTTHAPYS